MDIRFCSRFLELFFRRMELNNRKNVIKSRKVKKLFAVKTYNRCKYIPYFEFEQNIVFTVDIQTVKNKSKKVDINALFWCFCFVLFTLNSPTKVLWWMDAHFSLLIFLYTNKLLIQCNRSSQFNAKLVYICLQWLFKHTAFFI